MKKALKIIFASIISFILVLIIAVYAVLMSVDLNGYKDKIEKIVFEKTDRELKIGSIQVKPSLSPTIELRDVSLANASWAENQEMVSLGIVDFGFAVLPLLRKNFVIDNLEVKNVVLNLEEKNNENNWTFSAPIVENKDEAKINFNLIKSANAEDNISSKSNLDMLSNLVINHIAFDEIKINMINNSKVQNYAIEKLYLDKNIAKNIDFEVLINNGLYKATGEIGGLKLLKSKEGYPIIINAEVMGISVATNLKLFNVFNDISYKGEISASKFIGVNSGYNEAVNVIVDGSLEKVNAQIVEFILAENKIVGNIDVDLIGDNPLINANFESQIFDISSFMTEKKTASFSLISSANASTVVPDIAIPFEVLDTITLASTFKFEKIVNKKETIASNINIKADVNNGLANIQILDAKLAGGNMAGLFKANAKNSEVVFNYDITKANLNTLFSTLDLNSSAFKFNQGGDTDIYIKLSTKGKTLSSMTDALSGSVISIVGEAEVYMGASSLVGGDIVSQLLNTLQVVKSDDNLKLECAVVRADITDGLIDIPNGIAFKSDKFTVASSGEINLKDGDLNLGFKPFSGDITQTNLTNVLSSFVRLTGTIDKPMIGVDSANALKTIVGVTAAGPLFLGAQLLLENDSSPCYTALKGTGYEDRYPKPINSKVTDTTKDTLKKSGEMIEGATKGLINMMKNL